MSSTVRFKFKSAKAHSSVTFDGDYIRVADLKLAIFNQKNLHFGENFDLEIKNEQTTEIYKAESELIPRNSSVEVRRVPGLVPGGILAQQAMARKNERYADTPNPRGSDTAASAPVTSAPVSGASEGERLASLVEVSGKDYDRAAMSYIPRSGVPAPGERPRFTQHNLHQATVACRRCGDRGHTPRECPLLPAPGVGVGATPSPDAEKREAGPAVPGSSVVVPAGEGNKARVRLMKPTGIPTSSLAPLQGAGSTGTALVTQGGQIMVMRPNEDEFARQTAGLMRARELAKTLKASKKNNDDNDDEDDENDTDRDRTHRKDTPDLRPTTTSAQTTQVTTQKTPTTNATAPQPTTAPLPNKSVAVHHNRPTQHKHTRNQYRQQPRQHHLYGTTQPTPGPAGAPGFVHPGYARGMPVLPPLPPGALGQAPGIPHGVRMDPRMVQQQQQQQAYFQAVGAWMTQQQRQQQDKVANLDQTVNQTGHPGAAGQHALHRRTPTNMTPQGAQQSIHGPGQTSGARLPDPPNAAVDKHNQRDSYDRTSAYNSQQSRNGSPNQSNDRRQSNGARAVEDHGNDQSHRQNVRHPQRVSPGNPSFVGRGHQSSPSKEHPMGNRLDRGQPKSPGPSDGSRSPTRQRLNSRSNYGNDHIGRPPQRDSSPDGQEAAAKRSRYR